MTDVVIHTCQCAACAGGDHAARRLHHQLNLLMSRLDEQQRRWLAALESKKVPRSRWCALPGVAA